MSRQTTKQFSVPVQNEPGTLVKIAQLLFRGGINITAIMTESLGDVAYIRFLVDRENDARKLLGTAGIPVLETPVFHLELSNRPGELGRLANVLAKEGISIRYIYGTTSGEKSAEVILSVDYPEKAAPVLSKWKEKALAPLQN
ncbi:MAG: ACT domain-containing protein [bacterium]